MYQYPAGQFPQAADPGQEFAHRVGFLGVVLWPVWVGAVVGYYLDGGRGAAIGAAGGLVAMRSGALQSAGLAPVIEL